MKKSLVVILFCLGIQSVFATSWRVNNKIGIDANFKSLQEAIDTSAVTNGDTIYCDNGAFCGTNAVLDKQLTIIGPGYFLTEIDTSYANPQPASIVNITFAAGSSNSVLMGMQVTGDIKFTNVNSILIERNKINKFVYGSPSSTYGNSIIIRQNYIYGGITLYYIHSIDIYNNIIIGIVNIASGYTNQVTIQNNVIIYNGTNVAISTDDCTCINNIICTYNNVYSLGINNSTFDRNVVVKYPNTTSAITQTAPSGTNIWGTVTMDSVFVTTGSTDGKYQLKSNSPAIAYCLNSTDAGVFEGVYSYVLSGFPKYLPRIYEDLSTGAATSGGINIHIKAKSQED